MIDRQLLEQIDACRPGSNDANDVDLSCLADELAENRLARDLYQRVQTLDHAIGDALEDVPVPAGLSERIMARLAAEDPAATEPWTAASPPTAADLPAPARSSRRVWLAWASLAAAASIAAVAALLVGTSGQPQLTAETIAERALSFANQEEPLAAEMIEHRPPPSQYPFSRYVRRIRGTTWRPVSGFLNRNDLNGVAYELNYRGSTATLYVVSAPAATLPKSPPTRSNLFTRNRTVAAWQEADRLYVLVVFGDERTYQGLIHWPQNV